MKALFPEIIKLAKGQDVEGLVVAIRQRFVGIRAAQPELDLPELIDNLDWQIRACRVGENHATLQSEDSSGEIKVLIRLPQNWNEFEKKYASVYFLGRFIFEALPLVDRARGLNIRWQESQSPLQSFIAIPAKARPEGLQNLAQQFASALFLPKAMFSKAQESLQSNQRLADLFHVPVEIIEPRKLTMHTPYTVPPQPRSSTPSTHERTIRP